MTAYFAELALLPKGWARDVRIEVAETGEIQAVTPGAVADGAECLAGPAMPGMANLHSHAFQRALAGLAEYGGGEDSFWSWREVMYRFVSRLTPEQVEAIAAQLYVEMLKAGYTAVGEFHYLHHDPDGKAYADPAEMARRVLSAAKSSGIGMTLLPVLYGYGGFGGQPAGEGQRRFLNTPDSLLRIVETVRADTAEDPQVAVGLAPHSLRAVTPETLAEGVAGIHNLWAEAPVHIHVAEQMREVEACYDWSGLRPIEYLLESGRLDARWCLIHCTHATRDEVGGLAETGAVAGLCPTTEANLGDGIFPAEEFLLAGGRFGIGSDSHISVSPIEELRWLEYGQRLFSQRRNVLADPAEGGSVGGTLVRRGLAGGAQALARPIGRFAPGCRADIVVIDPEAPQLCDKPPERLLDALVFSGNASPVRDVICGGKWVVNEGSHGREGETQGAYRKAVAALLD